LPVGCATGAANLMLADRDKAEPAAMADELGEDGVLTVFADVRDADAMPSRRRNGGRTLRRVDKP
jgi:NADP-dependent 3-hydroxy acid dehydrogenase YdfG